MSSWTVTLIERLGIPDPSWPSPYGPTLLTPGTDVMSLSAATQNGCRTQDFSTKMNPFQIESKLERDLGSVHISKVQFDYKDEDGSVAALLGPGTTTFGTTTRYYSPWVMVQENGTTIFMGYLDQNSIEWDEERRETRFDAYHAAQILNERIAYPLNLQRTAPAGPSGSSTSFTASTGDDEMVAIAPSYVPRSNKLAIEQALWGITQISWQAYVSTITYIDHHGPRPIRVTETFQPPALPSSRILIGSNAYLVLTIVTGFTYTVTSGSTTTTYSTAVLVLQPIGGAPVNLASIPGFGVGSTVNFDLTYAERSSYTLRTGVVGPASGSDGQRYLDVDTIVGLIPGDKLTVPLQDTTTGKTRRTVLNFTVEDMDGEQCRIMTLEPVNQSLPAGTIIGRQSFDPIFADAYNLCQLLAAPFPVDGSNFTLMTTQVPVMTWLAADTVNAGAPQLYGANNLDVITPACYGTEEVRYTTRGSLTPATYNSTMTGNWSGPAQGTLNWNGQYDTIHNATDANLALEYLAPVTQWPHASAGTFYKPPVMGYGIDLSGGATIPPNGWAQGQRSFSHFYNQSQDAFSYWDGSAIHWVYLGSPGVQVTNGGSGYITAPTVGFSGGGGSGAAATAVIQNGQVVAVVMTAAGTGYTTAPSVTFTGGLGSGAAAVAQIINGSIPTEIPTKLMWYTSINCPISARMTWTGGTTVTYEQHVANGAFSAPSTASIVGTLPSGGNWFAFGMWPYPQVTTNLGNTWFQDYEHVAGLYLTGNGTANFTLAQHVGFGVGGSLTEVETTTLESGITAQGVWGLAGGLAVKISEVYINGIYYPYTSLYLVDEQSNVAKATLYGIEVIRSTICPLAISAQPKRASDPAGYLSSQKISGWVALGIESYLDSNYVISRRVRLIWFDYQLNVLNGDPVPSLASSSTLVRLGDIVLDPIPDGSIVARMVRANDPVQVNKCYGIIGGRRFLVDFAFSRVVERLDLSDNQTTSCMETIQAIMTSLLANTVPMPNGSLALVSRMNGTRQLRTFGGNEASFTTDELSKYVMKPSGNNYYNTINVRYQNDITGKSEAVTITGYGNGGTTLDLDLSMTNAGSTQSRAVGIAYGQNFGVIPSTIKATLRETQVGAVTSTANPPFWATWKVGDKLLPIAAAPGSTVQFWKLMSLKRDDELRTMDIELEQLPFTETL